MRTPVVLAFDGGFAAYSTVAIASALVHARRRIEIVCLCAGVDKADIAKIEDVCFRLDGSCRIIDVGSNIFGSWHTKTHYTSGTYLRLLIPELVDTDRALYIDGDVIVTTDLEPLLALDLEGKLLAGCVDVQGAKVTRTVFPPNEPYLNAGLLLLDLRKLRTLDFRQTCAQLYKAHPIPPVCADQCLINSAAAGQKLVLSARWNVLLNEHPGPGLSKILGSAVGSSILHSCGPTKPWMSWADPWLVRLWKGYARIAGLDVEAVMRAPQHYIEWANLAVALDSDKRHKAAADIRKQLITQLWRQSTGKELF